MVFLCFFYLHLASTLVSVFCPSPFGFSEADNVSNFYSVSHCLSLLVLPNIDLSIVLCATWNLFIERFVKVKVSKVLPVMTIRECLSDIGDTSKVKYPRRTKTGAHTKGQY